MVPFVSVGLYFNVCADHASSPKKRKATGPQHAPPPPTSQPQYTSPPFSSSTGNTPNRRHSRQRSDVSARGLDSYGRSMSRHRHTDSGFTSQGMASPRTTQEHEQLGQSSTQTPEPRRRSGGAHPVSSLLEQSDARPQSQLQSQTQRDPQYTAGPEMRHDSRRATPEEENSRRTGAAKRDEGRD